MKSFEQIKFMFSRRALERTILKSIASTIAYGEKWNRELKSPEARNEAFDYVVSTVISDLDVLSSISPDLAKVIQEGRFNVKKAL